MPPRRKLTRSEIERAQAEYASEQDQRASAARHEGGHHERHANGEFLTVNNTNDPDHQKRAPDSYYVSYGDKQGHVTQVFDSDGNQIGGD